MCSLVYQRGTALLSNFCLTFFYILSSISLPLIFLFYFIFLAFIPFPSPPSSLTLPSLHPFIPLHDHHDRPFTIPSFSLTLLPLFLPIPLPPQQNKIRPARAAFDAFFKRYPYCYGYWKKYADMERKCEKWRKTQEVRISRFSSFSIEREVPA